MGVDITFELEGEKHEDIANIILLLVLGIFLADLCICFSPEHKREERQ